MTNPPPLNQELFKDLMIMLENHFGYKTDNETKQFVHQVYFEALACLTDQLFVKAVKKAIATLDRKGNFFPSAEKLIELAFDGKDEEARAFEKNSRPVLSLPSQEMNMSLEEMAANRRLITEHIKATFAGVTHEQIMNALKTGCSPLEFVVDRSPNPPTATEEDYARTARELLDLWKQEEDFINF